MSIDELIKIKLQEYLKSSNKDAQGWRIIIDDMLNSSYNEGKQVAFNYINDIFTQHILEISEFITNNKLIDAGKSAEYLLDLLNRMEENEL